MADAYDFWAQRLAREDTQEIDAFWDRFAEIAQDLDRHLLGRAPHVDAARLMRRALGPLADKLFWEFGPTEPEGQSLAVTAETYHSRRALARAVMLRAPQLPGWRVSDLRRPVLRVPEAVSRILLRSRADTVAVQAVAPHRGAQRRVDLAVEGQGEAAFLADQAGVIFGVLLGDIADQNWLGETHVTRRGGLGARLGRLVRRGPRPEQWLERFRGAAVDVISALEAERPELPFAETRMHDDEMAEFRLDPRGDGAAGRHDALVYRTRYRPLVAARIAGVPVSSLRFSRFFESFCGLKIARGSGLPAEAEGEAGIAALARDIEAALTAAGIGGVTGHGQGVNFIYIDLALEDVELALGILRTALARAEVTAPAWMLFDEAGLADRYFPVTERAPATPMHAR